MSAMTKAMTMAAILYATLVSTASAQSTPVRWVVLEPAAAPAVEEVVEAPAASPDHGLIQGTMISRGRHYAVTATGMLQVGDAVGNYRVASVSLDRVVLSNGTQGFELDVRSGVWTSRPVETAAE